MASTYDLTCTRFLLRCSTWLLASRTRPFRLSQLSAVVANSRHTSHLHKCTHATAAPSSLSLLSVQVADPSLSPLPTFESVCKLPGRTVRHIPLKDRLAFALVLSSALRSAVHDNSEDAWLKLLMLPKCVLLAPKRAGRHHKSVPISRLCAQWSKGEFSALWNRASNHHSPGPMRLTSNHISSSVQTAVSLPREGLLSKACQTLTSSGLAPDNNTTWNLLVSKHPKGIPPTPPTAPLLASPYLPPDFNITHRHKSHFTQAHTEAHITHRHTSRTGTNDTQAQITQAHITHRHKSHFTQAHTEAHITQAHVTHRHTSHIDTYH